MPVLKLPGSTRITLIPPLATSTRSESDRVSRACLAAWYQPMSGNVVRPPIEETLTILPSPRSRMWGIARRASRIGAITIVSSPARATSSLTSSTAPLIGWPALLTSPNGRSRLMASSHAAPSATSSSTVSTSTPASAAALLTVSAFASDRTEPTDRNPRRATSSAVASPMPELAPVVTTVRGASASVTGPPAPCPPSRAPAGRA